MPLFTKQYKLVLAKQALHATHWPQSFHWCLAESYRNGDQHCPTALVALKGLALAQKLEFYGAQMIQAS